ncbi:hypothetical protein JW707_03970 [Candidatus Woesearchaeota archaeon]|nr:hypothetical protein [Candidatus Woesearchaeota archaeon]
MPEENANPTNVFEEGIDKIARTLAEKDQAIIGALTSIKGGYDSLKADYGSLQERVQRLEQGRSGDSDVPSPAPNPGAPGGTQLPSMDTEMAEVYNAIFYSIREKDYDIALGFLEHHVDLTRSDASLFYATKGTIELLLEDLPEAVLSFEKVVQCRTAMPEARKAALNNMAYIFLVEGNVDKAYDILPGMDPEEIEIVVYDPEMELAA